jgi:NADPH2 dehydrogenase
MSEKNSYKRIAQLRTVEQFRDYCQQIGADIPIDDTLEHGDGAPLAQPFTVNGKTLGSRFGVLPMEGWDGTPDGKPTDRTFRRWARFGSSGAKLIWGGEAVAVRHDGRANDHQLVIKEENADSLVQLRQTLLDAHTERFGSTDDLLLGLQLTHSGRFCRPNTKALEPLVAYHHPILDRKFNVARDDLLSDDDIDELIEDFGRAAALAQQLGFEFVDIKHCHGYLGHEFLSAVDREGKYGGSFENRTRFLRNIVAKVHETAPGLQMGVRLSAIDFIAFRPGSDDTGEPEPFDGGYPFAFGGDGTGLGYDLTEPKRFLDLLTELGIHLACITLGSPYYNPHLTRPATFPPSDGYQPPEDPLVGVARHLKVTAELKKHAPDLLILGSGYSYLQDWLPNVGQATVRTGMTDFVGLGRMMLSYPDMPADVLSGEPLQRKRICRTFSDCTTAPRNGIVSGCYPLDPFYKESPEYDAVMQFKKDQKVTS